MAAFYLTLRGTPIMYYGEEFGMKTTSHAKRGCQRSHWSTRMAEGKRPRRGTHPDAMGRHENAGFSKAKPWLPVPPAYKTHNVAAESQQPDSVLEFYRKVLRLRHTNRALLDGSYTPLNESDQNVFSYLRSYQGVVVLVALNMSASAQKVNFELSKNGFSSANSLLATPQVGRPGHTLRLAPYGVFIGQLNH